MVVELKEPGRQPRRKHLGEEDSKTPMMCPSCRVPLHLSVRQNVEIDYCPQCRGVWLDRGELDKIIERSASDLSKPSDKEERYRDRSDKSSKKRKKDKFSDWLEDLFD